MCVDLDIRHLCRQCKALLNSEKRHNPCSAPGSKSCVSRTHQVDQQAEPSGCEKCVEEAKKKAAKKKAAEEKKKAEEQRKVEEKRKAEEKKKADEKKKAEEKMERMWR